MERDEQIVVQYSVLEDDLVDMSESHTKEPVQLSPGEIQLLDYNEHLRNEEEKRRASPFHGIRKYFRNLGKKTKTLSSEEQRNRAKETESRNKMSHEERQALDIEQYQTIINERQAKKNANPFRKLRKAAINYINEKATKEESREQEKSIKNAEKAHEAKANQAEKDLILFDQLQEILQNRFHEIYHPLQNSDPQAQIELGVRINQIIQAYNSKKQKGEKTLLRSMEKNLESQPVLTLQERQKIKQYKLFSQKPSLTSSISRPETVSEPEFSTKRVATKEDIIPYKPNPKFLRLVNIREIFGNNNITKVNKEVAEKGKIDIKTVEILAYTSSLKTAIRDRLVIAGVCSDENIKRVQDEIAGMLTSLVTRNEYSRFNDDHKQSIMHNIEQVITTTITTLEIEEEKPTTSAIDGLYSFEKAATGMLDQDVYNKETNLDGTAKNLEVIEAEKSNMIANRYMALMRFASKERKLELIQARIADYIRSQACDNILTTSEQTKANEIAYMIREMEFENDQQLRDAIEQISSKLPANKIRLFARKATVNNQDGNVTLNMITRGLADAVKSQK
jgi:hypothetical protein